MLRTQRKKHEHQEVQMITRIAITGSLVLGIAMFLLPSAQAMSLVPLHKSEGMITHVRQNCGAGMRWNEALGRCATTSARRHVRRGVIN